MVNAGRPGTVLLPLLAGLLTACASVPLERVALAPERLLSESASPSLRCVHRLVAVIDRRPGVAAGSLGAHAFSLDDAAGLVRRRLLAGGFVDAPSDAPGLALEVLQLYIATNHSSKIPVAVYRASFDGGSPLVIRSHATSVNWNGTEAESLRALARALDDVDLQLRQSANARCLTRDAAG